MDRLLEYLVFLNEIMDGYAGITANVRRSRMSRKKVKARSNFRAAQARASAAGKPTRMAGGGMVHPRVSGAKARPSKAWKKESNLRSRMNRFNERDEAE